MRRRAFVVAVESGGGTRVVFSLRGIAEDNSRFMRSGKFRKKQSGKSGNFVET